MANFFEMFSIHYFDSLEQDPFVEIQKNFEKSIYAICTRSGSFEVFFLKTLLRNFRGYTYLGFE